jgi:hypothetical protein
MNEESKITEQKRSCENCACFHVMTDSNNPNHNQGFCRLDPPQMTQARMEVPRMFKGEPVIKNGKPVMEMGTQIAFFYKPMAKELVCFSGWRPIGTEPGREDVFTDSLMKQFKHLYGDLMAISTSPLGAFMGQPEDFAPRCIHGKLAGTFCTECPDTVAASLIAPDALPSG